MQGGVSEGSKAPLPPCELSVYGLSGLIEGGANRKAKKVVKNATADGLPRDGGSMDSRRHIEGHDMAYRQ